MSTHNFLYDIDRTENYLITSLTTKPAELKKKNNNQNERECLIEQEPGVEVVVNAAQNKLLTRSVTVSSGIELLLDLLRSNKHIQFIFGRSNQHRLKGRNRGSGGGGSNSNSLTSLNELAAKDSEYEEPEETTTIRAAVSNDNEREKVSKKWRARRGGGGLKMLRNRKKNMIKNLRKSGGQGGEGAGNVPGKNIGKRVTPAKDCLAACHVAAPPHQQHIVLHNKPPIWNETSQVYQLDFGGRVTQESAKNFQIEHAGRQVMQFGRIDTNAYTLDFQWPFSTVQAFSIALANITQRLK